MRRAVRFAARRPFRAVCGAVVFAGAAGPVCVAWGESPPAAPAALYNLRAYPLASFVWFPSSPHTGESFSLVSTSSDRTSPIISYAWDVADNGPFGPFKEGGPSSTASFPTPADHQVRLRVTAADHLSSTAVETIRMTPPAAGVLLPFPVVRIVGRVFGPGVRLRQLAVRAPPSARIAVTCQGKGCPARTSRRVAPPQRRRGRWTRFREFEGFLPAGAVLQVRVTKNGQIGAYTRFAVRRHRLPVRADSCLDSAGVKPIACPSS